MKKYLISMVLVAFLLLATGTFATADGGPHGSYTATTDGCAGCHRAHTGTGPQLLVTANTEILCLNCHGTTANGATTNVTTGTLIDPGGNKNLLGGGFTSYKGVNVTSKHEMTTTGSAAWGNGGVRGATSALAAGHVDCASCHDPHGSTNYRIMRTTVNGATVTVAQVDENAKAYDVEHWGAGQSQLCAACHSAYHQTAVGSGSNPAVLTGSGGYSHQVDMAFNIGTNAGKLNPQLVGFQGVTLPLADGATANTIVICQTCHLPHGTSASMTTVATVGPAADSALLREPNRAVCEACHQK